MGRPPLQKAQGWGTRPYTTAGTADASFTGQNQDTVSSLYDFTFRRHSHSQGRWISPDPLGTGAVDPGSPQTWNRYAYVAGNPLSFIDPLGLNLCETTISPVWGANHCDNGDTGIGGSGGVGSNDGNDLFILTSYYMAGDFQIGTSTVIDFGFGGQPPLPPDLFSGSSPIMPQKGFCSLTASVGDASQATQDAIQQIYNQAGVGIDFVAGNADLTVTSAALPQGVYGEDDSGSNAVVDINQVGNYPAGLGVLLSHEWGHYLIPCVHLPGSPQDCGLAGLMGPGNGPGHGPPGPFMIPQNPWFQFDNSQWPSIKQTCMNLHPSGG
jgi:RHS repeat-associated protein